MDYALTRMVPNKKLISLLIMVLMVFSLIIPIMSGKAEAAVTSITKISASESHSLAVTRDGTVWAWGANSYGQLGNGGGSISNTPRKINSISGVVSVSASSWNSLFLKSDGTVWGCGYNNWDQLGCGNGSQQNSPVQTKNLSSITAIAAGGYHSLAVKSDGTLWAWGNNSSGALGDGTRADRATPVQVQNLNGVTAAAAGSTHSLVLKSDGTVWAFGGNDEGQLGIGNKTMKLTPVQVPNLNNIVAISAADKCSLALEADGTVWAWGDNAYGQLGDGTTTDMLTPVQVQNLSGAISIAAGGYRSLAVKSDGTVWAWGNNSTGALGDGTTTNRLTPVQVQNLNGVTAAAAGSTHSLVLKSDGTVWAFGGNAKGQLGIGTKTSSSTPVQVKNLNLGSSSPTLSSITANPSSVSTQVGLTQQLTVTATMSDGSTQNVTSSATYQSSNTSVATVSSAGSITGISAGTANIMVAFDGQTTIVPVTINAPTTQSITVQPTSVCIVKDETCQLSVTATLSDSTTQDITDSATYQSDNTAIATVSSAGLVTGVAQGSANITVTYNGKSTTVSVTVNAPTTQSITVNESSVSVVVDETKQLTVTATMTDGSIRDVTNSATYQSSDTSIATVSSTGLVTGVSEGNATITASVNGHSATISVSVFDGTITSQTGDYITLRTPQYLIPVSYDCAAGFTVTENGIDVPVTKVVVQAGTGGWPYSEIVLSLEHPITVGSDNVVQYNPDPDHPITPVSGGTVTIPNGTVINNSTVPFTMTQITVPSSGNVVHITYPTAVTTVDYQGGAGYVIRYGNTTVPVTRVVTSGTSGTIYLHDTIPAGETVVVDYTPSVQYPITTVTGTPLTPTPVTVVNGSTEPVVVNPTPVVSESSITITAPTDLEDVFYNGSAGFRVYSNGQEIPVISVEVQGDNIILTLGAPIIPGSDVSYEYTPDPSQPITSPKGTPIEITSDTPTVSSLSATPNPVSVTAGSTQQLTVTAIMSDETNKDVTGLATYTVDNANASVNSTGLVSGLTQGSANVTVSYNGQSVVVPVTIVAPTGASLAATPNPVSIVKGLTQQLTVTATLSDGSTQDATASATYHSDKANANVNNSGLIRGVAAGTANVTVNCNGKTVVVPVTITASEVTSITATPNPVSMAAGLTQQLTVTATLSDGTTQAVTGLASYTVDNANASVNKNGLISGLAQGTANVTVSYNGQSVVVPVTVEAPVVASLSANPNPVNLAAGLTKQLTVLAILSDGTAQTVTDLATYSMDNSNASVDSKGLVSGVTQGSSNLSVSYNGQSIVVPVTVSAPAVTSLAVTPNPVNIVKGLTQQLTVTATLSDGSTQDVTSSAIYQSNSAKASVTNAGLVKGIEVGTSSITVSYNGQSVVALVTVTAPTVTSITATPSPVSVAAGETQQLTVTASLSDGSTQTVTGLVTYSVDNANASVSNTGLVKGITQGTANVTASYNGQSVVIPVTVEAPIVTGLSATPNPLNVATGNTQQLTVTANFSDGTTQTVTGLATYAVDSNNASVNSAGLVSGLTQGSANITISYNGQSVVVPVTVAAPTVISLTATPNPVSVVKGLTQQLTVIATLSDGTSQDVTTSAIYQSDSTKASINNSGLVRGIAVGTANVTVSCNGKTVIVPVTVTSPTVTSISATPSPVSVAAGLTQQLTVTATLSDGTTQTVTGSATYSVDNANASVNKNGLIRGLVQGTANVSVSYNGQSVVVPVTVESPVVTGLNATPNPVSVGAGQTQQLTVTATMSDGSTQDVTGSASYQSDNSNTIVDSVGLINGKTQGTASVTVSYNGKTVVVPVTVTAPTVVGLTVTPNPVNVKKGGTQQLIATVELSDGTTQDVSALSNYRVSSSYASVTSRGLVRGVALGTSSVIVKYGNMSATVPVNIVASVPQETDVLINPNPVTLGTTSAVRLIVDAVFSDGHTNNVNNLATFISNDTRIVTVDPNGMIGPRSPGSTTITVTYNGHDYIVPVTVGNLNIN